MLKMRRLLQSKGVQTCGAGKNQVQAFAPAIVEREGLRIAYLAFTCIFPHGYSAGPKTSGVFTIRAETRWEDPFPGVHAPASLPLVTTKLNTTDLRHLAPAIAYPRNVADLVVLSALSG